MPTKKPVATETAKKSVAKKSSAKKTAPKHLIYASNEESFWVADGQILNSLVALRDAFASMDKEIFMHHVTKDKNDFADWVSAVLSDADCAKALRSAKSPSGAKAIIIKSLKKYTI